MPFSMLWAAPSTTTMASSTTMPMARTMANRVERLTVNPSAAMAAKGADDGDRNRRGGHQHGPPILKEGEDDHEHQDRRLIEGLVDLADRLLDELGGVERDIVSEPLR